MQNNFRLTDFLADTLTDCKEIICLIGNSNYTFIYLRNGQSLIVTKTIGLIEKALEDHKSFVRIHKRYIVNFQFVSSIKKEQSKRFVCMNDGRTLAIARRRSVAVSKIKWLHY